MAKLKIAKREIALIKGLMEHEALNDQEILSIFSHLERNINPREMGWIRRGEKEIYQSTAAASSDEVSHFLNEYASLEEVAERIGIYERYLKTSVLYISL